MATDMILSSASSCILFFSLFFAAGFHPLASPMLVTSDDREKPSFAFSWLDDRNTFVAGDVATIKVKVLGNLEVESWKYPFNPNITVNEKMGNSSYISGISSYFNSSDVSNWRIYFVPIMAGLFSVLITDEHFNLFDSSLHFNATPGKMYPAAGIMSWMGGIRNYVAGEKAEIRIYPKDAFGNDVSAGIEDLKFYNFSMSVSASNDTQARLLNLSNQWWNSLGYFSVEFVMVTSGNFLLHVEGNNQTLRGSPLPLTVRPGALNVSNCMAQLKSETKSFQIFSKMEGFIIQLDHYGNRVSVSYAFDVEVVEKGTNLVMPVADLHLEEVESGVQLFSFSLPEPGNFNLIITDKERSELISNVPYDFMVYIGYCDGMNSVVNGSGLNNSIAGEVANFSVFLKDAYLYPSPIEKEKLQVQIVHESESLQLEYNIAPVLVANGSLSARREIPGHSDGDIEIASPAILGPANASLDDLRFSSFEISYTPMKSGAYAISIYCGNIHLNGGHPFTKEVHAGEVNMSLSGVVQYGPKVPKLIKNEIVIKLLDSYSNHVLSKESKLQVEIASLNRSGFSTWTFLDNKDGSYTGSYLANEVGTYELCVSFNGNRIMPCPFGVNVYGSEYFPKVCNETIFVWEDESLAFNALENDYYAGGNASILEFSMPGHGSLLLSGHFFRYTPYKGYYGNDSFMYKIADVNGNVASGAVNIYVLTLPPQFASFPRELRATEDAVSPKIGGFPGLELMYSDLKESITVCISADSGTVLLSPMLMQFWQPEWEDFSVNETVSKGELVMVGGLEVINFALQSIKYMGNEDFYGNDTMRISAMNRNGRNNFDVQIFVEPINDPPFIDVPDYVTMDRSSDEELIFSKNLDKTKFFVGDPDLPHFPGNKSEFVVMLSLEVTSGFLSTNVPANLINTTELKLKTSYQWQPLQTFVTISKHFAVKAKGIRFCGTVDECNSIIEQLSYHGGKDGDVLTLKLNDMGNYGCLPNCSKLISTPLFAEATVNLIRRKTASSLLAHALGSAIVIEFVMLLSLGLLLLFFMCKCAAVLINDKRKKDPMHVELPEVYTSLNPTSKMDVSDNASYFTACSSLLSGHTSCCSWPNTHTEAGEADIGVRSPSQDSDEQHQTAPSPGGDVETSGEG